MKKAQVTMFIIIGIVLLLVISGAYFIVRNLGVPTPEAEVVPEEFRPVANLVEACIQKTTLDAVRQMGAHGGYIDPFDPIITPNKLKYDIDPSRSELVSLTGQVSSAVPYYLHIPGKASASNYNYASVAPSIENMQAQIETYLYYYLPSCIDRQAIEDMGVDVVFDDANITSKVIIRDNSIEAYIEYPMEVTLDGTTSKLSSFDVNVNFPLKKYYDLALAISATEMATQFTESYTTNMLQYYSGVDFGMLPPTFAVNNKPYIVTWNQVKVNNDINGLLLSYTPALEVKDASSSVPVVGTTPQDAFMRSLSLEIFNPSPPNINVTFFYKDRSVTSKVSPSSGQTIKPGIGVTAATKVTPQKRVNNYRFFYDVSYPIIVEIRGVENQSALAEYSFVFALETNIIENKPPLAWQLGYATVNWNPSNLQISHTYPGMTQSGSATVVASTQAPINFFCDEDTWISGEYEIEVKDHKNDFIDGASVLFSCADFAECYITSSIKGTSKFTLPLCQGGYLSVSKEGYGSQALQLSTFEDSTGTLGVVKLEESKSILASVKIGRVDKVFTRDQDWEWTASLPSLGAFRDVDSANEQVILTLTQVNQDPGTAAHAVTAVFGKDASDPNISLVPGEYEVSAILLDDNGIIIPKECDRECDDKGFLGIGCSHYKYYPEDPIEMAPANWGGLDLNRNSLTTIQVTRQMLETSKSVEFKALKLADLSMSMPPGACIDALQEMANIEAYSTLYASQLQPEFK